MQQDHLLRTFAALGEPTRFAIVSRLLQDGETSAGDLSAEHDISPPAISRHLKVLHDAGLISRRIDRQRRLYQIQPQAIRAINDWAMSYYQFWNGSMDRLETLINGELTDDDT